jgi:hypothetical protein
VPRGAPGKLKAAAEAFYRPVKQPGQGNPLAAALATAAANQEVDVWPENWRAWSLFIDLSTQWSVGMGGRTGLRYESLYPLLDRMEPTAEGWDALFKDVQVMEQAALAAMYP